MTRRDDIVDAAVEILEAAGPDALTMRRLGEVVGMQAPSLYKHVRNKDDLLAALQARALRDIGAAFASTDGSVAELAVVYRRWAREHPALYELATRHPLARDRLEPGLEDAAAAPIVAAAGGDRARARVLWAVAHGLVDLEAAGRFPADADLDAVWTAVVEMFSGAPSPVSATRRRRRAGG